jgi:hypothetical protein
LPLSTLIHGARCQAPLHPRFTPHYAPLPRRRSSRTTSVPGTHDAGHLHRRLTPPERPSRLSAPAEPAVSRSMPPSAAHAPSYSRHPPFDPPTLPSSVLGPRLRRVHPRRPHPIHSTLVRPPLHPLPSLLVLWVPRLALTAPSTPCYSCCPPFDVPTLCLASRGPVCAVFTPDGPIYPIPLTTPLFDPRLNPLHSRLAFRGPDCAAFTRDSPVCPIPLTVPMFNAPDHPVTPRISRLGPQTS